jgi:uncharacterized protein
VSKPHFLNLFSNNKPVIACIHLLPLPGSPQYQGDMSVVYQQALMEADIFQRYDVDALIIENFRDKPFYPGRVPVETVAALTAVGRDIVNQVDIPVGINVLRNDAQAAIAIATAIGAKFIRVNVHMNAVVSEQGIIQGSSHDTLRLREQLKSDVFICADVGVKHAAALADRGLAIETKDLCQRGLVDAVIVSGELTGTATKPEDLDIVSQYSSAPVLIGSGANPENIQHVYEKANGFIVGSYFKKDGVGSNLVDEKRVANFMGLIKSKCKI